MVLSAPRKRSPKRRKETSKRQMPVTIAPKRSTQRTAKRGTHHLDSLDSDDTAQPIITPPSIVPSISSTPSLANLPAELRESIYNELLHESPPSLFQLLTVSRLICREVRPWIFKQPITFIGQQHLFRWLSRVEPQCLHYVKTIRFRLHDIDMEKIVHSFEERLRRTNLHGCGDSATSIGHPYKEACRREVEEIAAALQRFENLRTLIMLPSRCPRPPSEMERDLLDLVDKRLRVTTLNVPFCWMLKGPAAHNATSLTTTTATSSQIPEENRLQRSGTHGIQEMNYTQGFVSNSM